MTEIAASIAKCPIIPAPGYAVIIREDVPEKMEGFYIPNMATEPVRDMMCTARLVEFEPTKWDDDDGSAEEWSMSLTRGSRIMAMIPGNGLEYEVDEVRYNVIPYGCIVAIVEDDTPQIQVIMRYMEAASDMSKPGIMRPR